MTENLSKTAFSLVQIGPWSMPGGCEELASGLEPIRNREIFYNDEQCCFAKTLNLRAYTLSEP